MKNRNKGKKNLVLRRGLVKPGMDAEKPRSPEMCRRADRRVMRFIILAGVSIDQISIQMDEYFVLFGNGTVVSTEKTRKIRDWIGKSKTRRKLYDTWKCMFRDLTPEQMLEKANFCLPLAGKWKSRDIRPPASELEVSRQKAKAVVSRGRINHSGMSATL